MTGNASRRASRLARAFAWLPFALGITLGALVATPAVANLSGATLADFTRPPLTTLQAPPRKTLLVVSRDEGWFHEAYDDASDLDDDGVVDTTYRNDFEYIGYFDPDKCYDYVEESLPGAPGIDYFNPMAFTPDHYCDAVAGAWSGNFLNWASMTRMDVLRKVLYGGRRYLDSAAADGGATVLERTLLPHDFHAFAKYYNGADIPRLTPFSVRTDTTNGGNNNGIDNLDEGITLCNVTYATAGQSQTTGERPLIRIAQGNYSLWASGEIRQCRFAQESGGTNNNVYAVSGIDAGATSPSNALRLGTGDGAEPDFRAQVRVCMDGLVDEANNHEGCRLYPDGNRKPAGLVQDYGEPGRAEFGLFTGSYGKNLSGGVLRKNPGPIDDEINVATDGTFRADPNSATPAVGLIRTLDRLNVFGWSFQDSRYFGTRSSDNCGFQLETITEGNCASWGNPLAEIYAEAVRYFAGLAPSAAFDATDNNYIGGLDEDGWLDPLDATNACCGMDLVVINGGLASYDENTDHFTDIGAPNPIELTNAIGDAEGLTGQSFLFGRSGPKGLYGNDESCTLKTLNGLGEAVGVCPAAPTLDGTWRLAGMAHYAHTHDLRADLDGTQVIDTSTIAFPGRRPELRIDAWPAVDADGDGNPANDADVRIQPAYRLVYRDGGGTLTDFRISRKHEQTAPGIYEGLAVVRWDDTEHGADMDKDLWGTIAYSLDTNVAPPTLTVTTDLVDFQTNNAQLFGFVIAGTTQDGFHAYAGANGSGGQPPPSYRVAYDDADPAMADCSNDPFAGNSIPGTTQLTAVNFCEVSDPPRGHTFTVDTSGSPARILPDPLLLAAKYGGFRELDGDGMPYAQEEWDVLDADGTPLPGGDGLPDAHALVLDPAALDRHLRAVLQHPTLPEGPVLARESRGAHLVVESLYRPTARDRFGNRVDWSGDFQAFFVDAAGLRREDGNGNGHLDGYQVDRVVELFHDEDLRRPRARRHDSASDLAFAPNGSSVVELDELKPLWSAARRLNTLSAVTIQRAFTQPASNGRHLLTWRDDDHDGAVDAGETVPFTAVSFPAAQAGWLDAADPVAAAALVDWLRGADQPGLRSRRFDFGDGLGEVTARLGGGSGAAPVIVGAPAAALAAASGYDAFKAHYANRRTVAYGAADGFVHAVNGGFFDPIEQAYATSQGGAVAHPLGSELWAYLPLNLLGQVQWLAHPDYGHVPLVEGLQAIDVRAFANDATHPGGWGTLLVATLGFGAGDDDSGLVLDTQGDGLGPANIDGDANDDLATRSAVVLLDVTDPEQPPALIAELTPTGLGHATAAPAVVGNTGGQWYIVLGSGPTDATAGDSNQAAHLYAYDLGALVAGTAPATAQVSAGPFAGTGQADLAVPNSFVGDLVAFDAEGDGVTEDLYFGLAGGPGSTTGALYRLAVGGAAPAGWGTPFALLTGAGNPFVTRPAVLLGDDGHARVVAGSGRLLARPDLATTTPAALFGVRDPNLPGDVFASASIAAAALTDVSMATSFSNGEVDLDGDLAADTSIVALAGLVANSDGWRRAYPADGINPAARSGGAPTLLGGRVVDHVVQPSDARCGIAGLPAASLVVGLEVVSGVAPPVDGVFDVTLPCPGCAEGVEAIVSTLALGPGLVDWVPPGVTLDAGDDEPPPPPETQRVPALPPWAMLAALALLGMLAGRRLRRC